MGLKIHRVPWRAGNLEGVDCRAVRRCPKRWANFSRGRTGSRGGSRPAAGVKVPGRLTGIDHADGREWPAGRPPSPKAIGSCPAACGAASVSIFSAGWQSMTSLIAISLACGRSRLCSVPDPCATQADARRVISVIFSIQAHDLAHFLRQKRLGSGRSFRPSTLPAILAFDPKHSQQNLPQTMRRGLV